MGADGEFQRANPCQGAGHFARGECNHLAQWGTVIVRIGHECGGGIVAEYFESRQPIATFADWRRVVVNHVHEEVITVAAPTPYVGRLPNGFWDRFSKTRTSRLYKGYRIDGDGKQFTVQGNRFTTMREAQRWVDAEVREEGAAARYHERETARA
jgi:hypothetical protein